MPRVFQVRLCRTIELAAVAEDAEELRTALRDAERDFDGWDLDPGWDIHVFEPRNPDHILVPPSEPDIGVVAGRCCAVRDYERVCPDFRSDVERDARQLRQFLTLERVNQKLPFG